MGVEPLAESCKLAFEVARQGVEANPPIEPPASMRSFLYVAQLPRRAMTVAHRVIDTDPEFRQRVAAQATEAKVGRAGYLWLHRPEGWESSFSALIGESADWTPPPPPAPVAERPTAGTGTQPTVPMPAAPGPDQLMSADAPPPPPPPDPGSMVADDAPAAPTSPVPAAPAPAATQGADPETLPAPAESRPAKPKAPDLDTGRSEIENELASLRGLVDKLADERQNVGASVESLETEVVERRAESSALTTHLDSVSTDLQRARTERDAALTEKEDATERLVESERALADVRAELSAARVQLTRFETEKGDVVSDLATAKETAAALETQIAQFDDERTALRQQMESVVSERDDAWTAMADLRTERDALADRVRVAEQARVDLEAELGQVSANWQDLQIELKSLSSQRQAVEAELAELQQARQMSDSERQLIFTDLASTLGRVEAERDLLAGKLDATQARLQGTRVALDSATASLQGELDGVDGAFGETSKASASLDEAVTEATRRLSEIETQLSATPAAAEEDTPAGAEEEKTTEPSVTTTEPGGEVDAVSSELSTNDLPDSTMPDISIETETTPVEPEQPLAPQELVGDDPAALDELDPFASTSVTEAAAIEDEKGSDSAAADDSDSVIFGGPVVPAESVAGDPFADTPGAKAVEPATEEAVEPAPEEAGTPIGSDHSVGSAADEAADSTPEQSLDDVMESHGLGANGTTKPELDELIEEVSERTRISAIEGDPVAVARHAVSTPDVVILLDGDPIAEMGWPTLSVAERREALVGYLGNLAAETGAASDVVFEGGVGSEAELPVSRAVRVRLTHDTIEAVEAVAEVIGEYPLAWPVVVVSDDPRLAKIAKTAGASLLDNGQLLDLFLASS